MDEMVKYKYIYIEFLFKIPETKVFGDNIVLPLTQILFIVPNV
jgi:hypothetical protein